jgi:hypothetical protein
VALLPARRSDRHSGLVAVAPVRHATRPVAFTRRRLDRLAHTAANDGMVIEI